MSSPDPSRPRMSRGIKLVLMGVAGAALLYSCAPGIGAGLGALPYLWFLPNPFFRGAAVSTPTPATAPGQATTKPAPGQAAPAQSQRGGFGSTGSAGSGGSS
ncbi:hypothetical protein [Reyranella sp.]|uniref:hypothetical protein n=1 Tax=Reyranella sp. TaxID=1929291 RepID=UPI003BA99317